MYDVDRAGTVDEWHNLQQSVHDLFDEYGDEAPTPSICSLAKRFGNVLEHNARILGCSIVSFKGETLACNAQARPHE